MALEVLQPRNGRALRVNWANQFVLRKNRRPVRAALFTHQLGGEVRLLVGWQEEIALAQVYWTQDEVLTNGEQSKQQLVEHGWA